MAEAEDETDDATEETPKKALKLPLMLGVVLALIGSGGGFMAVQMGLIGGSHAEDTAEAGHADGTEVDVPEALPDLAFVPLDPLIISMPGQGTRVQLRFSAQLEVYPQYVEDVEALRPRITDVLNSYLRAVDMADLEDPTTLIRLRSQMLRRVQVVAGEGRVSDILIMEFVMN